jgi:hypothetical protein
MDLPQTPQKTVAGEITSETQMARHHLCPFREANSAATLLYNKGCEQIT